MLTQEQVDKLSLEELEKLEAMVHTAKDKERERVRMELRDEMIRLAAERGLTPEQVLGIASPAGAAQSRKVEPKYRHPDDPTLTWAGRGQRPKWLKAYIDQGGNIGDCKI